ncbi:MAG: shikimate dehydrogenase, partial [Oscillospiraceae bacterium]
MEFSAPQKRFCVIGDPVSHSKSPLLQTALLAHLGVDAEYLCKPVTAGELPDFLEEVRRGAWQGFNATMPHKVPLLSLLDRLDSSAEEYGAVNTVCNRDGILYGYNTDGPGFLRALADFGVSPAQKRVTVLGAGGAAKAVTRALVKGGAASITLCNRTPERSLALAAESSIMVTCGFSPSQLARGMEGCDLLVNCTSLGMTGGPGNFETLDFLSHLPPHAAVCDLIYAPAETPLLSAARAGGHPTMNGLPLLLHQGILSLSHFLGVPL